MQVCTQAACTCAYTHTYTVTVECGLECGGSTLHWPKVRYNSKCKLYDNDTLDKTFPDFWAQELNHLSGIRQPLLATVTDTAKHQADTPCDCD